MASERHCAVDVVNRAIAHIVNVAFISADVLIVTIHDAFAIVVVAEEGFSITSNNSGIRAVTVNGAINSNAVLDNRH